MVKIFGLLKTLCAFAENKNPRKN